MAEHHGLRLLSLLVFALLLTGCVNTEDATRGVYLIAVPPEGDAAVEEVEEVVTELLSAARPGDALALDRPDLGAREGMHLDGRPSRAVTQIRALSRQLATLAEKPRGSGDALASGLVQSVSRGLHFLEHPRFGRRLVILFSDLRGTDPRGLPSELSEYDFVAINSSLWRGGSAQAWAYLRRIDDWQRAVESRGGDWRVVSMERNIATSLVDGGEEGR
ncbi:MAG: hypothetical protein ACQERR_09540 [Pseudomonadota bacterium]